MNKKLKESDLAETKIMLLDSSFRSNELKKLGQKTDKIITFDYESHKLLLTNEIPHEISDDYLTAQDMNDIQNKSYDYIKWFDEPTVSNFLDYEGINLGRLFFVEFHNILIPFLKCFLEVVRIYQKHPTAKFFATPKLHSMLSILDESVTIIQTDDNHIQKTSLQSIKYGIKIGNKQFTISLSDKHFQKIKNFTEIFVQIFLSYTKNNQNKKNILLIEFSPTRYRQFFLNMPASNLNIILHNRRIPSIWDLESLCIIRKSKCIVTTIHGLLNNNVRNSINDGIRHKKTQINSLWENKGFFESFFSLNGISFWTILKPTFTSLFETKLSEYIKEIAITKKLFSKHNFSSILIWSESGVHEQIAIFLAKKFHVKIALIQHGLYDDTIEAYTYNHLGLLPNYSDKFLVWGKILQKYAISCGIPSEKIEIIGSPLYDDFFLKKREPDLTDSYILLATTNPQKNTIADLTFNSYLQREAAIGKISRITHILNKKLIIKLHPSPDEIDITDFVHNIDPRIIVVKTGNILDLMKDCEIFVTLNTSTTILEAQICKKPIISVFITDRGFGDVEVFKSKSCIQINSDELEKTLRMLFDNPEYRQKVITSGTKFSNEYLSNQGTASRKLLSFLEDF